MDILEYLKQKFPDINFEKGSAYYDFVQVLSSILEPLLNTVELIQNDCTNLLNDKTIDLLLENFGVEIPNGTRSYGVVRIWVSMPIDLELNGVYFTDTQEIYKFLPLVTYIKASSYENNQDLTGYFVDIPVVAENIGSEYNLEIGTITKIKNAGFIPIVKVMNLSNLTGGTNKESPKQLKQRAFVSLGARNFNSLINLQSYLFNKLGDILGRVQVINAGDSEMQRDIVNGVHVGGKVDIYVKDLNLTTDNVILKNNKIISLSANTIPLDKLPVTLIKNIQLSNSEGVPIETIFNFSTLIYVEEPYKNYTYSLKQLVNIAKPDILNCATLNIEYYTNKSVYLINQLLETEGLLGIDFLVKSFKPVVVNVKVGLKTKKANDSLTIDYYKQLIADFLYNIPYNEDKIPIRTSLTVDQAFRVNKLQLTDLIAFLYNHEVYFISNLDIEAIFYDDQYQEKKFNFGMGSENHVLYIPRTYQIYPGNIEIILLS